MVVSREPKLDPHLSSNQRLSEKGQGLRMERIDLAREIENSLDYEWQIFDEAKRVVFEGESIIKDGHGDDGRGAIA